MKNTNPALIYNLFPLLAGPFTVWGPHLERAAKMGFNWVFVNPFHYPGFSGSLYAVKDYDRLNPLLYDRDAGTEPVDQLRQMVAAAHDRGLNVMMDLVINHTAVDSPLTKKHPDWYCRDEKGGIKHPGVWEGDKLVKTWGDLAEIDNEHSPDRQALWDWWWRLMRTYLELGFDGFRCDAAYKVPSALWDLLITRAKDSFPGTTFFAESLGCTIEQTVILAGAGFDYVFNSSKYWDFEEPWCLSQYEKGRALAPSVSFPESHDTPRLAAELKSSLDAVRQRYVFAALFATGVMIPIGFEFGFRKSLHVVKTRPGHWEKTRTDLTGFIAEVNKFKLSHRLFCAENPTYSFGMHEGTGKVTGIIKTVGEEGPSALMLINRDLSKPQRAVIHNVDRCLPGSGTVLIAAPGSGKEPAVVEPGTFDRLIPGAGLAVLLRD